MKKLIAICFVIIPILTISTAAIADWNQGDSYKMHYPQLPDPTGWDISFAYGSQTLADDFLCTETGPISDLHFWVSWLDDTVGSITMIKADILSNNGGLPGTQLWTSGGLDPSKFTVRYAGSGNQGWDDPSPDSSCLPNNHQNYYQVNIDNIANPLIQQQGQTYWLALSLWMSASPSGLVGWKTTQDSWGSSAVYYAFHSIEGGGYYYQWDPVAVCSNNLPANFAFVITPEPTTICILGLGALTLLRKRK